MGNINEIMEKILDYGDYRAMCEAFTAASNNEHLSYEVRWQRRVDARKAQSVARQLLRELFQELSRNTYKEETHSAL
jgi:uncharacterized protein with von Willebrand factor type A (vWA) domain